MRSTTASLSLERKKRPRNEPPQRQGRATPLHTSTPSPRARRRDWPAPRTRSSSERGEPALVHTPKANNTHNKQPPKKKHSTRKKHARTNQGPGPAPPRRPLHIIQGRETRQRAAPPKREADAVYPPQHTRSALKNMSVERGKAGVPCEVHSTKRTPPRVPKPQPSAHTPSTSANPRRRRPTSVPTTTTENATVRTASMPSRGKRPSEPAPVPRAKRATARSTPVAPLAQARRRRVTCLELADRFPTAKPLNDGRTEPFRTSPRAPRCAARGPSRTT